MTDHDESPNVPRSGPALTPSDTASTLSGAAPTPSEAEPLPEHVAKNRAVWDRWAPEFEPRGRIAWASTEPRWGIWHVAEAEIHLLPDDLAGTDVIELGCGTGYVSAWLARRGARPVGIDNSAKQLESARAFQREFDLEFPLIHGNAEHVPYPDASFDLAISEYGACLWADPYAWVPEAARLLRPGGRLVFLTNHVVFMLAAAYGDGPAEERLNRPYFHDRRYTWPDDESVEFHLAHGEWIRLLRANGFEIERLVELQAPETPQAGGGGALPGEEIPFGMATRAWARRWPTEEAWIAVKRA